MMKYEGSERLKDTSKCAELRANLKMCLLESDCCKIHKIKPKECLCIRSDLVPEEFCVIRNSIFEFKRNLHKITPKECLRAHMDLVPHECYAFRNSFFECKRSLIDARRRFRGIKGHEDTKP